MNAEFEHVSDTALLVAASRALETERPDGLIRDPFAAKLAGEKGMALAHSMAAGVEWMNFGVGLRSHFIDELLLHAIHQCGVTAVLNLGAGLDTRPWRLDLPHDLRWIEVDFPAMLDYKAATLADEKPRCRLEQASADLNNDVQRRNVIHSASAASDGTLMLTEGLLMYLPAAILHSVATETLAAGGFRFWLFDITSPYMQRMAHGAGFDRIEKLRPETHLEGEDILNLVNEDGWTAKEHRSWFRDGWKIGEQRIMAMVKNMSDEKRLPPSPPPANDKSGVWLFESTS